MFSHVSVCLFTPAGVGGVPPSQVTMGELPPSRSGGTPIQVPVQHRGVSWGTGVPPSSAGWSQVRRGGKVPIPGHDGGGLPWGTPMGYTIQVPGQDGDVPQGTPPSPGWGSPSRSQVRLGYPPSAGWGLPPPSVPGQDRGVPRLEQYGVYLLRGGRYASCVHAGGLSCSKFAFKTVVMFFVTNFRMMKTQKKDATLQST